MAEVLSRIGPAYLFYGNPTTALGVNMKFLGVTKGDVKVTPGIQIARGFADQAGSTARADSVYRVGAEPRVGVPLLDEEKAKLRLLLPGSSLVTANAATALGFGSGFAKIATADIGTLCVLPIDQASQGTNGIDATDAVWFPGAIVTEFGDLTYALPDEGDDTVFSPRDTVFACLYRETDHAGTAIPAAGRVGWIGSPKALGLTGWTLPAPTP